MGHVEEKSISESHREALALLRRTTSFLLVLSVLAVALVVTLSAVHLQDAACQDRAQEVVYDNLLKPDVSLRSIEDVLTSVLSTKNGKPDRIDEAGNDTNASVQTVEVIDTAEGVISKNGFRFIRRSGDGVNVHFELRALFATLCDAYPTFSMEVMQNVDYEKVNYGVRAVMFNNHTRKFLLESRLTTKDANRIPNFAQFQKIFPGFYKVASGSGRLNVVSAWDYTKSGVYQIYYRNYPADIYVHIERWSTKDKPLMWRVFVSTDNILAEGSADAFERALRQAFADNNMLCGNSCDAALQGFLH